MCVCVCVCVCVCLWVFLQLSMFVWRRGGADEGGLCVCRINVELFLFLGLKESFVCVRGCVRMCGCVKL